LASFFEKAGQGERNADNRNRRSRSRVRVRTMERLRSSPDYLVLLKNAYLKQNAPEK